MVGWAGPFRDRQPMRLCVHIRLISVDFCGSSVSSSGHINDHVLIRINARKCLCIIYHVFSGKNFLISPLFGSWHIFHTVPHFQSNRNIIESILKIDKY